MASKIHDSLKQEEELWLSHFLQSSVLLTNLFLPSIVAFSLAFPMKLGDINEKKLTKKLHKAKKEEVQQTIKIFLMDYFASFLEHPVHVLLLEKEGVAKDELERKLQKNLFFNKEDKRLFQEIKEKKETYYPTILLLQTLSIGKDAHNQALVEGIDFLKEEVFQRIDKNFQTFFTEQKKD